MVDDAPRRTDHHIGAMSRGVDILIATPGRLLDLINQGHVRLKTASILVLDEADRMLDMGFIRDVRKIVAALPRERQSLLFSATMPADVALLAGTILRNPVRVEISPKEVTVDKVEQHVYFVDAASKRALLIDLLRDPALARVIVFTRTKHGANKVSEQVDKAGISTEALHGNKSQGARQRALDRFRTGHARVLVATDIAARGIDVDGITHVINFELPNEPESYVHRIGRTAVPAARAEAIPVRGPAQAHHMLGAIERATQGENEQMNLPSVDRVNENRVAKFLGKISTDLSVFRDLVERYEREKNVPRWRSPLHWRGRCCKARRRCCWSTRPSNRARGTRCPALVRVIKASAGNEAVRARAA